MIDEAPLIGWRSDKSPVLVIKDPVPFLYPESEPPVISDIGFLVGIEHHREFLGIYPLKHGSHKHFPVTLSLMFRIHPDDE